jgi:hypothetical protein
MRGADEAREKRVPRACEAERRPSMAKRSRKSKARKKKKANHGKRPNAR